MYEQTYLSYFYRVNWVVENGIRYECGGCVIIKFNTEEEIRFGQIRSVYYVNDSILLELKLLQINHFDDHLHAYCINEIPNNNIYFWTYELHDPNVYGLYTQPLMHTPLHYHSNCIKYIVLKYLTS
jgi:hypothetical protein